MAAGWSAIRLGDFSVWRISRVRVCRRANSRGLDGYVRERTADV